VNHCVRLRLPERWLFLVGFLGLLVPSVRAQASALAQMVPGRRTAALDASGTVRLNLALDRLDAIGHPEVRQAIGAQQYSVLEQDAEEAADGTTWRYASSIKTRGNTPEFIAVLLLHEYTHCVSANAQPGSLNDPKIQGTCGDCEHARMHTDDAWSMCEISCLEFVGPMGCSKIEAVIDTARTYIRNCLFKCPTTTGVLESLLPRPRAECCCHTP